MFVTAVLSCVLTGSYLDLGNNLLSGSIPDSLLSLSNLQYLRLSNNWLSGQLPEQIGFLFNLQWVPFPHSPRHACDDVVGASVCPSG